MVEVGTGVDQFQTGDRVALGADFLALNVSVAHNKIIAAAPRTWLSVTNMMGVLRNLCAAVICRRRASYQVNDDTLLRLAGLSEPVACRLRGFNERFFPASVTNLCIFGAGPIGSIIATIAKVKMPNAGVIFIEPNAVRRQHLESLGIGDRLFATAAALPADMRPDLIFVACSVPKRNATPLSLSGMAEPFACLAACQKH